MPKGVSIPFVNLFSTSSTLDFNLLGYNVRQSDQRYMGWMNTSAGSAWRSTTTRRPTTWGTTAGRSAPRLSQACGA